MNTVVEDRGEDHSDRGHEFERWFGLSKVRSVEGAPLEVFHGTAVLNGERRTVFELTPPARTTYTASQALGFFFARSYDDAGIYAECAVAEGVGEEAQVVRAFLSIQNPFITSIADFYSRTEYKTEEEINSFRESMINSGYDGIFVGPTGDVVAFYPEQIKSSVTNTGRYDRQSRDITDGYFSRSKLLKIS